MSDDQKERIAHNLWKTSQIVTILLAISALASAWVVIPHRVESLEERMERMEERWEVQTKLLIRIDERVEQLIAERE